MTQLNERFIKARRDYEALLEASMTHPPQQQAYGQRPAYTYGGGAPQQSYAPPSAAGAGYGAPYSQQAPPPQSDPRYASPPPQSDPQYPPQNGPQPFYFVPPGQGGNAPRPRTSSNPAAAASTDDLYTHPGAPARTNTANDPRRQTIAFGTGAGQVGIPQELATGSFDSPVEQRHQNEQTYDAYAVQPGKAPPSSSSDSYAMAPDGYTQGQGRPPVPGGAGPGGLSSLPSQQRPPPAGGSPVYQAYGAQYTAYNPSSTSLAPSAAGGGYPPVRQQPAAAAGSEESYYR
jgi:signal transducing adaptor molecule